MSFISLSIIPQYADDGFLLKIYFHITISQRFRAGIGKHSAPNGFVFLININLRILQVRIKGREAIIKASEHQIKITFNTLCI